MSKWDQIQRDPEFQALSPEEKQQFAQVYTMRSGDSVAGISSLGVEPQATVQDNGLGAQFGAGLDETQGALWAVTADALETAGFANATAYARKQQQNNFNEASQVGYQTESLTDAFAQGDILGAAYGGIERLVRSSPAITGTIAANAIPVIGQGASLAFAGATAAGGIRQEQIERGNDDKMAAYLAAAPAAVAERFGLKVSKLLPTGKVAGEASEGLVKRIGSAVAAESVTEAGQEALAAVAAGERDIGAIGERSLEAGIGGGLSGGYLSTGKAAIDNRHNITAGMGKAADAVGLKFEDLGSKTNLEINGDTDGAARIYAEEYDAAYNNAKNMERNSPEFLDAVDTLADNIDGLKITAEADVIQELADNDTPINGDLFDDDMSQRYQFNEGLGYKIGSSIQRAMATDQEIEQLNLQKNKVNGVYQGIRAGTNKILSNLQRQKRSTLHELNRAKAMKKRALTPEERSSAQNRINELTSLIGAYNDDLSLVRGIYEGIKVGAPDASPEKIKLALNFDLAAGTNLATQLQKAAVAKSIDSSLTEKRSLRESSKVESSALRSALAVGTGGVSIIGQAIAGRAGTAMRKRAQAKAAKDLNAREQSLTAEGVDTSIQPELDKEMTFDEAIKRVDSEVEIADVADAVRKAKPSDKDDSTAYAKAASQQGATESVTGNAALDDLVEQTSKKDYRGEKKKEQVNARAKIDQRQLEQDLIQTTDELIDVIDNAKLPEDQKEAFLNRLTEEFTSDNIQNKSKLQHKARRFKGDIKKQENTITTEIKDATRKQKGELLTRQSRQRLMEKNEKENPAIVVNPDQTLEENLVTNPPQGTVDTEEALQEALSGSSVNPLDLVRGAIATTDAKNRKKKERNTSKKKKGKGNKAASKPSARPSTEAKPSSVEDVKVDEVQTPESEEKTPQDESTETREEAKESNQKGKGNRAAIKPAKKAGPVVETKPESSSEPPTPTSDTSPSAGKMAGAKNNEVKKQTVRQQNKGFTDRMDSPEVHDVFKDNVTLKAIGSESTKFGLNEDDKNTLTIAYNKGKDIDVFHNKYIDVVKKSLRRRFNKPPGALSKSTKHNKEVARIVEELNGLKVGQKGFATKRKEVMDKLEGMNKAK